MRAVVQKDYRRSQERSAVESQKDDLRRTLAEMADEEQMEEVMGSSSICCLHDEPVVGPEDALAREVAAALESPGAFSRGIPTFIVETTEEQDLSELGIAEEIDAVLTDGRAEIDEILARGRFELEADTVEAVLATAPMATTADRAFGYVNGVTQASKLDSQIDRLETHVTCCSGCRRGTLLRHYVSWLYYLLEEVVNLPGRIANRLFDRLVLIEARLA